MPDTAAHHLRSRRRLGVWSEMVSDGVMRLEQDGALDRDGRSAPRFSSGRPSSTPGPTTIPRLVMRRTEVVNDPARIAAHPALLSVNTALQVDLFAQANASYVHGTIYSGFGGQPDFVVGALHSKGGHAVVCLRSWHDKSDTSTVVPILTRSGLLVPALGGGERARQCRDLRTEPARPGPAADRARRRSPLPGRPLERCGPTRTGSDDRLLKEGTFGPVTRTS